MSKSDSKKITSQKKGSNIICRVSNVTPEMVCNYVSRLPKTIMSKKSFRTYMGDKWFQNEHQAPEQWGLYYVDEEFYYPRFNHDITIKEAEQYINVWMKRLIVINPYTRFKSINNNNLVISIVKEIEQDPREHDLKTILQKIVGEEEPLILNEIIVNAINNYSEVLSITTLNKDEEKYTVNLLPNYKQVLKEKYTMTKKEYFDLFSTTSIDSSNLTRQKISYGAPGTGKSHQTNEIAGQYADTVRTTFHPDSDYSTFVGSYKPTTTEELVYGLDSVGKTVQFIDPNTNKPLKTSKIEYKFVKQAFLKAYILAWQKMCSAGVGTSTGALVADNGKVIYTIDKVESNRVICKKEEGGFPKTAVSSVWDSLWRSGAFVMPTGGQSGKSIQQAISQWIYDLPEVNAKEDFAKGWDKLIAELQSGKNIDVKKDVKGAQTYTLAYNDDIETVKVTSLAGSGRDAIRKCYEGGEHRNSVEEIAKILKGYALPTFEEAWNKLADDVNNQGATTTILVADEIEPQFLVVEEINRGNCAQIFGDIFQLLDRKENYSEYPIEADEDIQKALLEENPADGLSFGKDGLQLPDAIIAELQKVFENSGDDVVEKICKGQVLVLPKNLYIWATMNTSDQSLFPIDSAFKRRWDWEYVPIVDAGENWVIDVRGDKYNWWTFLEKVNKIINTLTSSEDKKLGYFFAKAKGKVVDTNTLVNKVFFYLWNDVFKDYELSTIKTFPLIYDTKESEERPFAFGDFFNDKTGKIEEEVVKQFLDALMLTTKSATETTDQQAEE